MLSINTLPEHLLTRSASVEYARGLSDSCVVQPFPSRMFSSKNFSMYGTNLDRSSVARMCRAAMSSSFLRWATSCGQTAKWVSMPFTRRELWVLTT